MDPLERERTIGWRHRRGLRWGLVAALFAVAALGLLLVPQNRNDREQWEGGGVVVGSASQGSSHSDIGSPAARNDRAVGTAGGSHGGNRAPGAATVREIETITGANDAMALVGHRVDLHVDVQSRANDVAFWVGTPDNRVLVVLGRDHRDGARRQAGEPAGHRILPVQNGQRAAISGVVQPIPRAEHRYSWDLTEKDWQELQERKIYIRAETVTPEAE
jgi:hypothetical protein